jgi:hypothetical protein
MLRDRAKQKAKSRVKSKAKSKVRGAVRDEGGPKVLKAAAIGGTAYYAGKKIKENRQEDETEAYQAAPAPAPAALAADAGSDTVAQLQQLAQMHESGILTDEEFASAKQKLLAGG